MAETRHFVTAPIVLGPRSRGLGPGADYTTACEAGVRAWADLLGRAAMRLRTPAGEITPLAEALAVVLEQEGESAASCIGYRCPPDACEIDVNRGVLDFPGTENTGAHHHCDWCNAWTRQWEEDEPPMVRLARAVLETA